VEVEVEVEAQYRSSKTGGQMAHQQAGYMLHCMLAGDIAG
jgi:hypothetical protein